MGNEIFTSVFLPIRGRQELFRKAVASLNAKAKYPKNLEYLVLVDNDDRNTIKYIKKLPFFKTLENFRVFSCNRVGYHYLFYMIKELLKKTKGDIILPFADDLIMRKKNWDAFLLNHKDKVMVFSDKKMKVAFTRKAMEKYELIRSWGGRTRNTEVDMARLSMQDNCNMQMGDWYSQPRVGQVRRLPRDKFDLQFVEKNFKLEEWPPLKKG